MHHTAHHHLIANDFVKQNVLVERTKHDKETPLTQSRMLETARRPKPRVPFEKLNVVSTASR